MAGAQTVTRVEPIDKKKFRIFLDEEYAFFLYVSEIRQYKIAEGVTLSDETIAKIQKDCVRHHAVRKAMALLKSMDRTEKELTDRLRREGFPEDAVQEALSYVMSYGYVDDASYADRYVYSQKEKMSLRTIRQKLLQKGIPADLIEGAIAENEVSEDDALKRVIEKKTHGVIPEDFSKKQKLTKYLLSKGFTYGQIGKALHMEEEFD